MQDTGNLKWTQVHCIPNPVSCIRSPKWIQDFFITFEINTIMTRSEFNSLCAMLYVHPSVALENERVVKALQDGAHEDEIACIIEEEF